MRIEVEIPDGKLCRGCIFWSYGGSGSVSPPFCTRFSKHPDRYTGLPYETSYKLKECRNNAEPYFIIKGLT